MQQLKVFLIGLVAAIIVSAGPITYSVTVTVTEDGADNLILQGNTLSWQHLSLYANGGVAGGSVSGLTDYATNTVSANNPYILVSGTDTASVNFTNSDWYNGIQGFACTNYTLASPQNLLNCGGSGYTPPAADAFTLPDGYTLTGLVGSVSLTVLECAGVTGAVCPGIPFITRDPTPTLTQPSVGNGNEAIVSMNDVPDAGTHVFEVELTWTDSAAPEPASAALLAVGLTALVLVKRRLARNRNL